MKESLTQTKNTERTLELIRVAGRGDAAQVRAMVEQQGYETGVDEKDIDFDKIQTADQHIFPIARMARVAEEKGPLNAPLYWAAFCGKDDVARYFLERGDYCQSTLDVALFGAVHAGSIELARDLVARGADTSIHEIFDQAVLTDDANRARDMTDFLLGVMPDVDYALGVLTRYGDFTRATALLDRKPDISGAIRALAQRTSDKRIGAIDEIAHGIQMDYLDLLLSYAKASGEYDVQHLAGEAIVHAMSHWSTTMAFHLLDSGWFTGHPETIGVLDYCMTQIVDMSNPDYDLPEIDFQAFARRLLTKGASPQNMLIAAVDCVSAPMARIAIAAGADPRADKIDFLSDNIIVPMMERTSRASALVDFLQKSIDTLDRADAELYAQMDKSTPDFVRRHDAKSGRSVLMIAAAAGKIDEALDCFRRSDLILDARDIMMADKNGGTLLNLLLHRDAAHKLFDPSLWQGKAAGYRAFYDALPEEVTEKFQDLHVSLLNKLQSDEAVSKIKGRLVRRRNQWRL